jgi:hypothetical protein
MISNWAIRTKINQRGRDRLGRPIMVAGISYLNRLEVTDAAAWVTHTHEVLGSAFANSIAAEGCRERRARILDYRPAPLSKAP